MSIGVILICGKIIPAYFHSTFKLFKLILRASIGNDFLKGHGNEADFLGFCINRFGIGPLQNILSRPILVSNWWRYS
jgi:hypothetical protein